ATRFPGAMSRLIEDYALVSDLQTASLVHRDGSIDWCCFPGFDSDACFAALLGRAEHGCWRIAPQGDGKATRRYRDASLVLESEWETGEGRIRVTDFMPPRGKAPDIVRIVEGLSGRVSVRSELVIRFGYGSVVPKVRRLGHAFVSTAGSDALAFRTPVPTSSKDAALVSSFGVSAGDRIGFTLTWFPSRTDLPPAVRPEHALRQTETFWRDLTS